MSRTRRPASGKAGVIGGPATHRRRRSTLAYEPHRTRQLRLWRSFRNRARNSETGAPTMHRVRMKAALSAGHHDQHILWRVNEMHAPVGADATERLDGLAIFRAEPRDRQRSLVPEKLLNRFDVRELPADQIRPDWIDRYQHLGKGSGRQETVGASIGHSLADHLAQ